MRNHPLVTLGIAAVFAATTAFVAAACTSPPTSACVPRVQIEPKKAHAGHTIEVSVEAGCDIAAPSDGWIVYAAPVGKPERAVTVHIDGELSKGFHAMLTLPAAFPTGEASAGLKDWDYSTCADSASCAGPSGSFTVLPAP
jgi:hypothetical protein